LTFYYSKGNGKAKLIICAIGNLQILLTNYTAVPSTTNFIATNGLPVKIRRRKDDTVDAVSIHDSSTSIINQADSKRKQSNVVFDNARLAARRVTRAASSLPIHDNERRLKTSFFYHEDSSSERPTRFQHFREIKVYFLVNNVDLRSF